MANLEAKLRDLLERIKSGRYKASPTAGHEDVAQVGRAVRVRGGSHGTASTRSSPAIRCHGPGSSTTIPPGTKPFR